MKSKHAKVRRRMPTVAAVASVVACVMVVTLTVGAAAAGIAPQHVTNQQVTSYSWAMQRADNHVCPTSPDVTRIDETLSGPVSGDPRESGTAEVHAVGYEDDTDGAGFLHLTVRVTSNTQGRPRTGLLVARQTGYVTLSNPSKLGLANARNGLLPGISAANAGFPRSIVVSNITGYVSYALQGLAPVTITSLDGTLGDAAGPDGPLASPQRTADDNPGVFVPIGSC